MDQEVTTSLPPGDVALSVLVVVDGAPAIEPLLRAYRTALDGLERSYEVICVFDARSQATADKLQAVSRDWPNMLALAQRPWTGEDGALVVALGRARGELVLTLPSWPEVDAEEIPCLVASLGDGDMVIAERVERERSWLQRLRVGALNGLLRTLFGHGFGDVFCRVRVARRDVMQETSEFGVRQHFLPLLALSSGFRVREVAVKRGSIDGRGAEYRFRPLGHLRAALDIMALFVALKFLKRPLRFFGFVGLPLLLFGLIATGVLVFARLFLGEALADRPALIFSVMMVVLGVQIIALGLIGEIIVFSSTKRNRDYEIDEIIKAPPRQ